MGNDAQVSVAFDHNPHEDLSALTASEIHEALRALETSKRHLIQELLKRRSK